MLWSTFKELATGAYFILFSSYGSAGASPVEVKHGTSPIFLPSQRISLEWEDHHDLDAPVGLLLKRNEADDLIRRLCKVEPDNPELDQELGDQLFELSAGHAGALAGLVESIVTHHVSTMSCMASNQCSLFVFQAVLATRKKQTDEFKITMKVFREVFFDRPNSVASSEDVCHEKIWSRLTKSG